MGLPDRQPENKSQPGSQQAKTSVKPVGRLLPQRRALALNLLPQKKGGLVGGKLSSIKKAVTAAGPSNNGAQRGATPSVKVASANACQEQGMVTLEVDEIGGNPPEAKDFASIFGRGALLENVSSTSRSATSTTTPLGKIRTMAPRPNPEKGELRATVQAAAVFFHDSQ